MKGKQLISIIGAGNHGTLLALLISQSNKFHVKLLDTTEEVLSRSHMYMESILQKRISKGKIDHQDYYSIFENISVSTDLSSIKPSVYVMECVSEHLPSKTQIISEIDKIVSAETIVFSTTMSLSITKIASFSKYPERIVGLHFFALPIATKVVEIVSGLQTSPETIRKSSELAESLGKEYSFSKDCPGFIANKIVFSFINEGINSFAEGVASKEDIDKTIRIVTGMNIGPLEMADEIGLDCVLENLKNYHKVLGDDKYRPSPLLVNYVSAGWIGKKSGQGFYNYQTNL